MASFVLGFLYSIPAVGVMYRIVRLAARLGRGNDPLPDRCRVVWELCRDRVAPDVDFGQGDGQDRAHLWFRDRGAPVLARCCCRDCCAGWWVVC